MNTRTASLRFWPWIVGAQAAAFLAGVFYCLFLFPFLDQIDWIDAYFQQGIASIFLPHNSHRLPIPRLILIADINIFDGYPVINTCAVLAAVAGLAMILNRAARAFMAQAGHEAKTAIGAIAILLLLRGYTLPDYVISACSQFILSLFFTALALWTCTREKVRWRYAQSVTYGILASGCGANGLVVFPMLAWIAWRLHQNRRAGVVLALFTVVYSLTYIHGADLSLDGAGLSADHVPDPWDMARFIVEYFGMPWERLPATYVLAFVQGAFIIGVLSFLILRRAFRGPLQNAEAFLLAMAGALLLTALMIALGRVGVVDLENRASRYSVFIASAEAVMFILIAPGLRRLLPEAGLSPVTKNTAVIAFLILLLIEQGASASMVHSRTAQMADAKRHVCAGDMSTSYLTVLYFADPRHAYDFIQDIKARKLYCFSGE